MTNILRINYIVQYILRHFDDSDSIIHGKFPKNNFYIILNKPV